MAYPSSREAAASCYDTSRKQWWMAGGCAGQFFGGVQNGETWSRSSAGVWTQITATGGPIGSSWCMAGAAYLPTQDVYLMTCGRYGSSYSAATYWFNPATSAFTAKTSAPQTRAYFGNVVWDPVTARVYLHGGYNGGLLANTLKYNPASDTWTDMGTLSPGPGGITAGWWAYNTARSVAVYFGGDTGSDQNKIWEFNGTTWTDRTTSGTKPTARRSHMIWYDPVVDAIYLVGGTTAVGQDFGATVQNDFWKAVYNNSTNVYDWTAQTSPALPTGPAGKLYYSLAGYDPDRLNGVGTIWGGCDANAFYPDAAGWTFNSRTGQWRSDLNTGFGAKQPGAHAGFGG